MAIAGQSFEFGWPPFPDFEHRLTLANKVKARIPAGRSYYLALFPLNFAHRADRNTAVGSPNQRMAIPEFIVKSILRI